MNQDLIENIGEMTNTGDIINALNAHFSDSVKTVKDTVYSKLSACEGPLYEAFKAQYDSIIQSALDEGIATIQNFGRNIEDSASYFGDAETSTRNKINEIH